MNDELICGCGDGLTAEAVCVNCHASVLSQMDGLRNLLREAADMLLAGAALMPDEMMYRWEGMRGMVERIGELDIQR